jgi:hypothetical protein
MNSRQARRNAHGLRVGIHLHGDIRQAALNPARAGHAG